MNRTITDIAMSGPTKAVYLAFAKTAANNHANANKSILAGKNLGLTVVQ
jgi:hypothetical protein